MVTWFLLARDLPIGLPCLMLGLLLLLRLSDHAAFLIGLRMVLRATRQSDRVAALRAYMVRRRGRNDADPASAASILGGEGAGHRARPRRR